MRITVDGKEFVPLTYKSEEVLVLLHDLKVEARNVLGGEHPLYAKISRLNYLLTDGNGRLR